MQLVLDTRSAAGVVAVPSAPTDFAALLHATPALKTIATTPQAPTTVHTTAATAPTYSINWAATTPAYAQGSLLGGLACAPTALAMITAHFHAVNPSVGAQTPAQFVANLQPGEFIAGEGVPYTALARQLVALGYTQVSGNTGNTLASLRADLAGGPVIVTAGADTLGRPGSHSLVVVAVSNDASTVILNDPATGTQTTLSWATFAHLWAGGNNGILIVRP